MKDTWKRFEKQNLRICDREAERRNLGIRGESVQSARGGVKAWSVRVC